MSTNSAPVTRILVWTNVIIHTIVMLFIFDSHNETPYEQILQTFGLIPSAFWAGAVWQPITSMFLHSPVLLLHILVNMLSLWSLGLPIERTIGSMKFAYLYFVSGAMGSLFVVLFQPELTHATIGASGAIFGLLGALAVFYPRSVLLVFFIPMKARTAAFVFGSLSLLAAIWAGDKGFLGMISHLGHLGGLVGGVLYSRFVLNLKLGKHELGVGMDPEEQRHPYRNYPGESRDSQGTGSGLFDSLFRKRKDKGEPKRPKIEVIGPNGRVEKIINPSDEELRDASDHEEKDEPSLYFDPTTGKFYLK